MPDLTAVARRALPLVDLTTLTGEEDEDQIVDLCRRASTPAGDVAAVCVYPKWVNVCVRELAGRDVFVAAVANFPEGALDADRALHDTELAREDGADEVDVVLPFAAWLAGDERGALLVVEQVRGALPAPARLKVILETGALGDQATIRAASYAVLGVGADFVKTSTGKRSPGATPEAARTVLEAIAAHGGGGFKASGGVRSAEDAATYLARADELLGPDWATPATFRLGASSLVDDLAARLG